MKVIIAGSRTCTDMSVLNSALIHGGVIPTEVVCGTARGADTLGEQWAKLNNIPIKYFKPDYDTYGRYEAPKLRNQQMADYAEGLIALWDGKSNGTRDMIKRARSKKLWIYIQYF